MLLFVGQQFCDDLPDHQWELWVQRLGLVLWRVSRFENIHRLLFGVHGLLGLSGPNVEVGISLNNLPLQSLRKCAIVYTKTLF